MNVEAMQFIRTSFSTKSGGTQTQASKKDFVDALKNALVTQNENYQQDQLVIAETSLSGDGDGLLEQLKLIVSQLPNSDAFLNKEILQSKDVQTFLSQFPEDLVSEINQIFSSGLSLDEIVAMENFTDNEALLNSTLIMLTQKNVQLLHQYNEPTSNQFERLLPFLTTKNSEARMSDEIQGLLKKLQALVEQLSTNNGKTQSFASILSGQSKEEVLQTSFEQLKPSSQVQTTIFQFPNGVGTTMNPLQQLVIHVGESNQQISQQQFIRQFQEILGRSSLQNFKNGTSQLSIKLYPEHLGRLDVNLTQINGMIIAKIMTTSSSAKELIESQLHQLRQAFASQQINVERVEISHQQVGQSTKEQSNQQSEQQQSGEEKQEHELESHKTDRQFSDVLEEMTINEKV